KEAEFRITPTLNEVELLINAGVDAIAIDGTKRSRFDQLTLEDFIKAIKSRWTVPIIADVSTLEEGLEAWKYGADMIGTTLSGYTSYSKHPIKFGELPLPEPDYELISELRKNGVRYVVAEGRINNGFKMHLALNAGAHCVVIGTSISEPKKIVTTILLEKNT
ncbi:MAG: IMP dehydrogenase, partial [Anaerolineaceae bacterium]|nr:IMP dehydrogenase [Anaerolineaceae bacterium]